MHRTINSTADHAFVNRLLSGEELPKVISGEDFEDVAAIAECLSETLGRMTEARAALHATVMNVIHFSMGSDLDLVSLDILDNQCQQELRFERLANTLAAKIAAANKDDVVNSAAWRRLQFRMNMILGSAAANMRACAILCSCLEGTRAAFLFDAGVDEQLQTYVEDVENAAAKIDLAMQWRTERSTDR